MIVGHISWNCSEEFDADQNETISFLDEYSYAMAKEEQYEGSDNILSMDFKTIEIVAPLLINYDRYNLIVIEIVNGNTQLLIEQKGKRVQSVVDLYISDGRWHTVEIHSNRTHIEVKNLYL